MGFLDLHGGLGRQFGSIGVALDNLRTSVTLTSPADTAPGFLEGSGEDSARALRYAAKVRDEFGSRMPLSVSVDQAITPHAGLGSGTQLALAVGLGVSRLLARSDTEEEIAQLLGRGKRSAIGISCFKHGGFVIDGGKGSESSLPPTLMRLRFPERWRLILIFDKQHQGVNGSEEVAAFERLPRFPDSAAAHLCRLTLMRLMPGLVEQDVTAFGAAVTEIQQIVGDHFAPVQGGRFASPGVRRHIEWFEQNGAPGVGQSSWGPTGFALCASSRQAEQLIANVPEQIRDANVELGVYQATNSAGQVGVPACLETV